MDESFIIEGLNESEEHSEELDKSSSSSSSSSSRTVERCGSVVERQTMEQKVGVEKYLRRFVPLSKMFTPQKYW